MHVVMMEFRIMEGLERVISQTIVLLNEFTLLHFEVSVEGPLLLCFRLLRRVVLICKICWSTKGMCRLL